MNIDLQHYLEEKRGYINDYLRSLIPEFSLPHKTLHEAAAYSLNTPGKRLRPILTLAAAEMLGGSEEQALPPACAIELVHTYSMIHDDLPCMDDDDFRRGLPTLHKAYPESIAVLAGDYLLTYAFQVLSDAPELSDRQKVALINVLATHAGGEGMIAGQVMDIEAEDQTISKEHLQLIHVKKTGFLISAALEFGAIIANTSDKYREHLKKYGLLIGLAFQIMDDVLDVTHSLVKHGKSNSSDVERNKSTYVSLMGVDNARKEAEKYVGEARKVLSEVPGDTKILDGLATYILNRF